MWKRIASLAFLLGLAACANPVSRYTASRYWDAAIAARDAGNWHLARSNWSRTILNAQAGGVDKRTLAIAYYEYGRSSGVICDWKEAETGLLKSLDLDRSINGPVHLSIVELGRLYFDQKRYEDARRYFADAYARFEEMNAETRDPLGYAAFLDEYSASIEMSSAGGDTSKYHSRAEEIRRTFPKGVNHTDRTPYGTACAAP